MIRKLFVLVILASGCKEPSLTETQANVNEDIILNTGDKVNVQTSNNRLSVEIIQINESRCPSDVVCITIGSYGAELSISDGQDKANVDLCNWNCSGEFVTADTASFTLSSKDYKVVLKDLLPYPSTINQDQPKKLILKFLE